jgi:hypothetical protein
MSEEPPRPDRHRRRSRLCAGERCETLLRPIRSTDAKQTVRVNPAGAVRMTRKDVSRRYVSSISLLISILHRMLQM